MYYHSRHLDARFMEYRSSLSEPQGFVAIFVLEGIANLGVVPSVCKISVFWHCITMLPGPDHVARRSRSKALETLYGNLALRTESATCIEYFLKSDNPFILSCLFSNKNLDRRKRARLVNSGVTGIPERTKANAAEFRRGPILLERWNAVHNRRNLASLKGVANWTVSKYGEFTGRNYLHPLFISNSSVFFLNECPKIIDPYGVEGWDLLFVMAEGWSSSMKELLPVVVSILAAKKP